MTARDELHQEINEAHQRFLSALRGFEDTVLETQPICGVWSARDVAGHIADWNNEILDAVEGLLAGQPPKRQIRDIDSYNADQAAARGIDSWTQTEQDFRAAWARTLQVLDERSQEDLDRIAALPWGPVVKVEEFFRRIATHTMTHASEAESWRWRVLGVPERHE